MNIIKQKTLLSLWLILGCLTVKGQTDVTKYFLENYDFDSDFHYSAGQTTAVSQEILEISHWEPEFTMNYTIAGVYEFGFNGTFNNGKIPSAGYEGSTGGGLVLSTGWSNEMIYTQELTLPAGTYTVKLPTYNGFTATLGNSRLAWIPEEGTVVQSTLEGYPSMQWTLDQITFTLNATTKGKLRIGYQAGEGGSSNSANIVIDYVQILATDMQTDKSELEKALTDARLHYDADASGEEDLRLAIEAAQAVFENAETDMPQVILATKKLNDALQTYRWLNASDEKPFELTGYIMNPSFERNGLDKWVSANFSAQSNGLFEKLDGKIYVEKWVSRGAHVGDACIRQTISLPMAKYKVSVAAANIQQDNPDAVCQGMMLYADDQQTDIHAVDDYSVTFVNLTGDVELGVVAENATGNWITLDNFRIHLLGGVTDEMLMSDLHRRITGAEDLMSQMMSNKTLEPLREAIESCKKLSATSDEADINASVKQLSATMANAKVSISEYAALRKAIDEAEGVYDANLVDADVFFVEINKAKELAADGEATSAQLANEIELLATARLLFLVANGSGEKPTVVTYTDFFIQAAHGGLVRATFSGEDIIEKGVCWSKEKEPTINDHRETTIFNLNGSLLRIKDMAPASVYYARPYAITASYAIGYGEVMKIVTLPEGNSTGSWNNGAPTVEANNRCSAAIQNTIGYLNEFAGLRGFHLTGNYGSGTPTADCGYGGGMRIGPNAAYQATGTVLHETGHGVGVGTHYRWYSCADTRANTTRGKWLGSWATKTLQFLENRMDDEVVFMTGDAVHGWGANASYDWFVNGASADTHQEIQYIGCASIYHALFVDGLCPTTGYQNGMAAYTFNFDEEKTYYIKCEDANFGLNDGFLSRRNNNVVWKQISTDELTDDEKWYVEYDPATCNYRFRNVATGYYMAHSSSGKNVTLKNTSSPTTTENFQLMPGREHVAVDNDIYFGKMQSYWFTWQDGATSKSMQLNGLSSVTGAGIASVATFNFSNSATAQRFILIPTDAERVEPDVDDTLPAELANADFEEGDPISAPGICTYDYDMEKNNTTLSQLQDVPGWTIADNGNGRSAGLYAYGGSSWLGSNSFIAPVNAPEATEEHQALGITAVWGQTAHYYQNLTLDAGDYILTYVIYNAGGTGGMAKNLCGFTTNTDERYMATTTAYPVGQWTTETIKFSLGRKTTGMVGVGYVANGIGSANTPHLFVERVELKKEGDTAIRGVINTESMNGKCYDLSGRPITNGELLHGIYIINGKKVYVKP